MNTICRHGEVGEIALSADIFGTVPSLGKADKHQFL